MHRTNPGDIGAHTPQARIFVLARTLQLVTETPAQRLAVLKQLGTFRFRKSDPPEARKEKLNAALAESADVRGQSALLAEIWSPHQKGLLECTINKPSEVGRAIARRLKIKGAKPLTVLAHRFEGVAGEKLEGVQRSSVVAYLRKGAIHLVGHVGEYLRSWQTEGEQADDPELTPLHVLLLHELIEAILQETTEIDGLAAHVVATTFERSLVGGTLPAAVESFLVDWESQFVAVEEAGAPTEEPSAGENEDGEGVDEPVWGEFMVSHDDLRPEAFVVRTVADQKQILREMFGDEEEDGEEEEGEEMAVLTATGGL